MGVKINKIIEEARQTPELSKFANKTVAIDAFNSLYAFLSSIRQYDGRPFTNSEGKVTSHLMGLFSRNAYLLESRIKPVYVFDGEPIKLKTETIKERREHREEAKKKADAARDAGDMERARRYAQASSKLETYMIEDAKKLLELMGIPSIQAPSEGEAQASILAKEGLVTAVSSQDYDCFLFGAPRLLRNLTQQKKRVIRGKSYPITLEYYQLSKVLESLEFTRDQLIDLGILIGTDFNDKIPRVGQKTALKLVQKHGCLEEIYKAHPEYEDSLPLELGQEVRKIFKEPPVLENPEITFKPLNTRGVIEFLHGQHGFSKDRITDRLRELGKNLKKKTQKSLESFF